MIGRPAPAAPPLFQSGSLGLNKIGGKARAMVVCNGIDRAIQYFVAFRSYLAERKSPYRAIVAFSGDQWPPKDDTALCGTFMYSNVH